MPAADRRFRLLDVDVDNVSMTEALGILEQWSGERRRRLVAFVNASCLNISVEDPDYRRILESADLVLADGIGVRIGARMGGVEVRENVNGTDLFPLLCERAAASGTSLYLLGSADGVAEAAGEAMAARFPGLRLAGTHHGFFTEDDEDAIIADINASAAAVLLVAMGVPAQEKWLDRVGHRLDVPVQIGVGALFDLTSGRVPRAPRPVRAVHLEWAWRLAMEPRRMWRRYIVGNPLFLARCFAQTRTASRTRPRPPATGPTVPEEKS